MNPKTPLPAGAERFGCFAAASSTPRALTTFWRNEPERWRRGAFWRNEPERWW